MKQGFGVSKIFVYLLVFFGLSLSLFGACGTYKDVLNLSGSSGNVATSKSYYTYTPSQNALLRLTVKNNSSSNRTLTAEVYADSACTGTLLWGPQSIARNNQTITEIPVLNGQTYYITVKGSKNNTSYNIIGEFSSPEIKNIPDQKIVKGIQYIFETSEYVVAAGYDIQSYEATNLPVGLSIDSDTGTIHGTPTATGNKTVTLKVKTSHSTAPMTKTFKINVVDDIYDNSYRDFTLRYKKNLYGDMKAIGNTVMVPKTGSNCNGNSVDPTTGNSTNNGNQAYIMCGYSGDGGTMAKLELPSAKAKVVWAGLYWQSIVIPNTNIKQAVYIKKDNSSYKSVSPNIVNYRSTSYKYSSSSTGRFPNQNTDKTYSAFADVTKLFNDNNWHGGEYTVKGVPAAYGMRVETLGAYGAWTLVVVYDTTEDTNRKMKNVSIYDGWKEVNVNTVNIPVSGFFTPTKGDISANLAVFAAEGDRFIEGDTLSILNGNDNQFKELTNSDGKLGNAFNSSITGVSVRTPNRANNMGIDIQNHDVSSYMANEQSSTTLKFYSSKDVYWPSMIAFSTELYVPDVCYREDLTFKGADISSSNMPEVGDTVDYRVMITNRGNEIAKGVKIEKDFNKPNELKYISGSLTPEQNVYGTSSTYVDGEQTYDRISLNVGAGSSSSQGGTVGVPNEYFFSFKGEIGSGDGEDEETLTISENVYRVSYKNDDVGVDFKGVPIGKCVDFNNTFGAYIPVLGEFNVARAGATSANPVDDALYTQVVNQDFSVDILSLSLDRKSLKAVTAKTKINIYIADVLTQEMISPQKYQVTFDLGDKNKQLSNIKATKASKNANFKIEILNSDGSVKNTIDTDDTFAIRPATFSFDTVGVPNLVGGKFYTFNFIAQESGSTLASSGYTQVISPSLDKNATTTLVKPIDCNLSEGTQLISTNIPFVDGISIPQLRYSNVGDVNITIVDSEWTFASEDQTKGHCVANSSLSTHDGSGRVGCVTEGSRLLHFYPAKFDTTLSLSDGGNGFTYLSDSAAMSANINLVVDAKIDTNATASNYTEKCFARDITTSLTLDNNSTLGWGTPQNRMMMFDGNATINPSSFTIPSSSFSAGVANLNYGLNFNRDSNISENPFAIKSDDLSITSMQDSDGVNTFTLDNNTNSKATFGFGRAHVTNQRYVGASGEANVFFEIYCFTGCDKSLLPNGVGSKNSDDIRWFINENHDAQANGKAISSAEIGGKSNVTANISGSNKQKATINYGGAKGYPYKTTMELPADDWLIYEGNTYSVEFSRVGSWVGKHETNITSEDNNITPTTTRRIQW